EKQIAYNLEHGITPQTVTKAIRDLLQAEKVAEEKVQYGAGKGAGRLRQDASVMSIGQIEEVIKDLEKEMKDAARSLNFEYAAELRDEINELRKIAPASKVGQDGATSGMGKDNLYKTKRGKK